MADEGMVALREALGKVMESEHADLLRESVALVVREVMELEARERAGAERYERSGGARRRIATATARGSGTRGWARSSWRSRSCAQGTLPAELPGAAEALRAGAAERGHGGLRERRLDAQGRAAGRAARAWRACPRARSARICQALDERVEAFRSRPLEGAYPYLWLDARVERVRETEAGMVRQKALLVAYARARDRPARGDRPERRRGRVRGRVARASCASSWRAAWAACSWSSPTPTRASRTPSARCWARQWQRCCVHFVRDMLGHVPRQAQPMVRGALKQIFAAPDRAERRRDAGRRRRRSSSRRAAKSRACSRTPRRSSWPTCASRASTGRRSEAPTRWSASTWRSRAAQTSSASTPTTPRCCASRPASWSSRTTSG